MRSLKELSAKMLAGEVPPPPVARLVGFTMTRIENGEATAEMDAGEEHANPMGTLHGGILCDLADAAMGMAYASTLDDGESFTTLEIKTNFLRPFWEGHLVAEARVVNGGRTVGLVECEVRDDEHRLIAKSTSTQLTLRGDMAEGR